MRGISILAAILLAACSPSAVTIGPDHPANPDAPAGRLAGPPPAIAGFTADPPAPQPSEHDHSMHQHGGDAPKDPPVEDPHKGHDVKAPDTKPADPKKPADTKKPADPKKPTKKPADTKKPDPKKPADDPHKGHDMKKPADTKKPAEDPHKGHGGHSGHAS